jgi:hypothetical protein
MMVLHRNPQRLWLNHPIRTSTVSVSAVGLQTCPITQGRLLAVTVKAALAIGNQLVAGGRRRAGMGGGSLPPPPRLRKSGPVRALLIVDVQNDFIDGSLAVPRATEISP